jgi:mannan endo-1,4-beta-mannosidase
MRKLLEISRGWYFIDFIYLSPAPAPPPHNITKILVSPDPLPCTWALFNTLLAKYGSGDIFSGQADPTGVAWLEANLNVTPAIIGLDMIDYSPTRVVSYHLLIKRA